MEFPSGAGPLWRRGLHTLHLNSKDSAESRRVALQSVPGITFVNVAGEIEVVMELGAFSAVGFACPVLCVKLPTARESVSFLCDRNTE